MEGKMGSEETSIPRNPSKPSDDGDAPREISNALQLHNSSPTTPCVTEKDPAAIKGNNNNSSNNNEIDDGSLFSNNNASQYCYYLLEAMPLPGPTWSTTEPSIIAPFEASMGLGWGDNMNQASSNIWWMEFVEGLDDGMIIEQ
ncbi:hypothetical protein RIF29_00296 [Crotalaria pallida]|uniref:Uncharacterized protein n=1 Tax=Crotalaria pallida TaxID=3830 RepID=A0AAN9IW18_CROPI